MLIEVLPSLVAQHASDLEKTAATAATAAAAAYCVAAFPERADRGRREEARGRATAAWWEAAWEME